MQPNATANRRHSSLMLVAESMAGSSIGTVKTVEETLQDNVDTKETKTVPTATNAERMTVWEVNGTNVHVPIPQSWVAPIKPRRPVTQITRNKLPLDLGLVFMAIESVFNQRPGSGDCGQEWSTIAFPKRPEGRVGAGNRR